MKYVATVALVSLLLTCPEDLLGKFHGFACSHSLWLYHQKTVLRGFNNSKATPSSSKTSKESSNQVSYFKYFRNYYFALVLKIWFHFEQGGKKWQKLTKYILVTWQFDKGPSVWGTHIQGLKLTVQLKTIDGRYKIKTSLTIAKSTLKIYFAATQTDFLRLVNICF